MTTALSTGIRRVTTRLAPDPAPDGELLSRFLSSHDEAAFSVLVRRHSGMVFGTCRRVLGNATDADDAFQAAFVVLVRKAHSLTDRACVGNFLYGVAFHTALKARAMATKRRAKEAKAMRPESAAEADDLSRVLDEELAKLPEKYREPVVLCELEGVSRRDAASRLGIPEGTISSRLSTAHRMLQKRLKARGFAAAGITAVLGSQAFAVSDSLTQAAVRAAISGAPAGVTQLAVEVTKMFLLSKLKVGTAVLAGVVLLLGVGVGMVQRGIADDKPGLKAPVPAKEDKKDEDRIQGLWQAESLEAGGQNAPDAATARFQVRFKGTDITFVADDRTHKFELDPTAKPKALNLTPGDGAAKGKKLECAIYDLDGDTLKICMDKEGMAGKRPTEFKTTPKDGLALIVLKRVKEPAEKPDDAMAILGRWAEVSSAMFPPPKFGPTDKVFKAKNFWTFGKDGKLTNVSTVAGETHTGERQFELKPDASPKELTLTGAGLKMTWSYELSGDTLKVALCGDGKVRSPSIDPKDIPQGVAVTVIEFTREPDKGYSLKVGEVLKLIPAPFPAGREKVFDRIPASKRTGNPADNNLLAVTVGDGADEVSEFAARRWKDGDPVKPLQLLHYVKHLLKIDTATVSDPTWLLESTVLDADVVLRAGAKPDELLTALSRELKAKCGIDVTFAVREVESEVVVLSGKHTLTRRPAAPGRPYNDAVMVEVSTPFAGSYRRSGATSQLPAELATYLGRPVVDESDLKSNDQAVWVGASWYDTRPAAEDRDPATALKRFADQTGLTAKLEKRKVRALVVAKADKVPDDAKKLLGKWVTKSVTFDPPFPMAAGETRTPAQHTLTFTDKELTWLKLVPGEPRSKWELTEPYQLDPTANPKELTSDRHKCVYELDGNTLKVALYASSPGRPKGFTAENNPSKQVMLIELTREKDEPNAKKPAEPAWKAEFRKAYGLTGGQLVRRVAPPYPDCREEYFNDLYKRAKGGGPGLQPADWFVVLGWKDDWTHDDIGSTTMPIKPDVGISLERLLDMTLKFPKTRIESDRTSLDRKVTGDFVVRAGADPEKVAAQLEAILRKELELPVKFSFKDAEEEVFVLSGKYQAKPMDDRKADQIEVYAKHLTDRATGGGGTGTLKEMIDAVERHVNKPIVLGKVEGEPKSVSWHYNVRQPMVRDPAKGIDTYAEDTNAPAVLYNIAQQTGLTVTTEKRKVRTLVVEFAEVKK